MKYRLADLSDVKKLASIHLKITRKQAAGSMYKFGLCYFRVYYKILLKEKNRIILVAEDENGLIYGFTSGTLTAEEHLAAMKKNQLILAVALIPAVIRYPEIIKELIGRKKYIYISNNTVQYSITSGPRVDYWGWLYTNKHLSIPLFKAWLKIAFERGASSVKGDIYAEDDNLINIQKYNGARIVDEVVCHDGRKRIIIEFVSENARI